MKSGFMGNSIINMLIVFLNLMSCQVKNMIDIIDLSQEIYTGMPVFPSLPEVNISMHVSHEQWDGINDSDVISPAVNRLELGEHTGTHVDALNHMGRQFRGQSIDTMPLTMFYTEGICLDLSHCRRSPSKYQRSNEEHTICHRLASS